MRELRVVLVAGVLAAVAGATAQGLEVPLTVAEPIGVARQVEPISAGVPFAKGAVADATRLSLWDGPREAPCQFTVLAKHPDGSVAWVLVDFQATVPARGTHLFTLKDTPAKGQPTAPVEIVEPGGVPSEVRTGPLSIKLAPKSDVLFTTISLAGKEVATGLGLDALTVKEATSGKLFQAAPPEKVAWEYRGPMRATLRLDGTFRAADGQALALGWTLRLTVFAGLPAVRIETTLASGDQPMKIARASLGFRTAGAQSADAAWVSASALSAWQCHSDGIFFPSTFVRIRADQGALYADLVPEFAGQDRAHPGYLGGGWWLPLKARKSSQIWLDFGRPGSAERAPALQERLLAVPPGEYVSDTEGLFFGPFATLAQEKACYRKWGWTWQPAAEPKAPPAPGFYKANETVHEDSETPAGEGYLLMFLRTGERGFFDRAEGWERFYQSIHAERRPAVALQGFTTPRDPAAKSILDTAYYSRQDWYMGGCHDWGWDLADRYHLTGDVDAKEALIDLADVVVARSPFCHGKALDGGKVRAYGRHFLTVLAAWQVTGFAGSSSSAGDTAYRDAAARIAAAGTASPAWDAERGYWHTPIAITYSMWPNRAKFPPALKKIVDDDHVEVQQDGSVTSTQGTWTPHGYQGTFHTPYASRALYRWWQLTGDEAAKRTVIGLAGLAPFALTTAGGVSQVPYWKVFDFPRKGMTVSNGWMEWVEKPAAISGWYTAHYPDQTARGFLLTGDRKYLESAKRMWEISATRKDGLDRFAGFDPNFKFEEKDCTVTHAALMLWAWSREK